MPMDRKERVRLYVLRYQRLRKLHYVMFLGGKCVKCGYHNNLAALDFHHPDGKTEDQKELENWRSPKFRVEECVLMCCRCHREEEHPELDNYEETYQKEDQGIDLKLSEAIKAGLAKKTLTPSIALTLKNTPRQRGYNDLKIF